MIEVYTDAATDGNRISGAGIYIKTNDNTYKYSLPLERDLSNHEAEFLSVIKALEICQKKFPNQILSFRSDAKIVVDTIEKNFTKNKAFQPRLEKINLQKKHFPLFFIKWIPSSENKLTDELAKRAIQMQKG